MRVKLFTHTDLDGVGCAVVANVAFGAEHVSIEYCDYDNIDSKVSDFIFKNKEHRQYDRVFITDISIGAGLASLIDGYADIKCRIQLIDHHATALWLSEKYPMWCEVRVEESNMFRYLEPIEGANREKVSSSGTSLFYKFLRNKNIPKLERNEKLKTFAEVVRRYDCWEWHNVYKNEHPKRLNDLLYIIGRDKFIERFSSNPIPTFTDLELTLLEIEEHRINKYIWYKMRDVKKATIDVNNKDYNIAYVFAEANTSLLGNYIAEAYGDKIDFVAIIDVGRNKVSLRGIHNHIDLGKDVAKRYGGGGHSKASGFEFPTELLQKFLLDILVAKGGE